MKTKLNLKRTVSGPLLFLCGIALCLRIEAQEPKTLTTKWDPAHGPYELSDWVFTQLPVGSPLTKAFAFEKFQDPDLNELGSSSANIPILSPSRIGDLDRFDKDLTYVFLHSVTKKKEDEDILLSAYIPFCPSRCFFSVQSKGPNQTIVPSELKESAKPRIVPIASQSEEVILALSLFAFEGPRSILGNPIIGTVSEIQTVYLLKALRVLLFSVLELFSFVFFAFIYIRRRTDKFNLSFALLNLSMAIWYPSYEGWTQYLVDSPWIWVIFGYSLGAFLPILFYEFTIGIFQAKAGKLGRFLQFLFILLTIWPTLEYSIIGGHPYFGKYAFQTFLIVLVFFYGNTLYIFYRYRRSSILSYPWVVSGLILVAVSSFYTVLSFAGFSKSQPWVNESFLGLTLLFSLALAKRYAEVFRALEKSQLKLKLLNESLESKVVERTRIIELQKAELVQKGRILEKDLSIAGKIQNALLPRELPVISNASISYRYLPMMEVGGDLLDALYDPKTNCLGMFIGDVTGHGVSAALLASMLKMTLGEWSKRLADPSSLLLHIREQFEGKLDGHFITATLVTLDLNSGQALIANAGHPECLILRKKGKVEFYRPKGVAIYEAFPTTYQTEAVELFPGDKIVLYTDGIPDSRNSEGEFFGEDRLANILEKNSEASPETLCDFVMKGVQSFQGESQLQDDMALLVVEFSGKSE
ncbi:serine/threonine-protein phosphatase [Leptospira langatensis]|uniref:Serine/threonine-protein phosphatase n=1 Tax=Leptospira langatensis TaxID=2484983 RepID=A0A5F1ZTR6_9LEPT|nr:SpoIIE family protein phosphatase [Leptospira langatensis]TGK02561.1 serine/threonine-protein phosphatase [Leptospira langatensis]TGL40238.1 serine/threonine-protein phosphatase [Leptospira langatensis]